MNMFKSGVTNLYFHRDCVQCRAFKKGEKKDTCSQGCKNFSMTLVESRDKLPQPGQPDPLTHCKEKDVDDCWFYFTYSVNANNDAIVHVVETPGTNPLMHVSFTFVTNSLLFLLYSTQLYWLTFLNLQTVSRSSIPAPSSETRAAWDWCLCLKYWHCLQTPTLTETDLLTWLGVWCIQKFFFFLLTYFNRVSIMSFNQVLNTLIQIFLI